MSAGRCFGHGPMICHCVLIECEPRADVLPDSCAAEAASVTFGGVSSLRFRLNEDEAPTRVSVKEDL